MDKRFLIIIGVMVAAFVGFIFFTNGDKANAPSNGNAQPTSHVIGDGIKGVTLLEYGDFQCPFCAQYHPITQAVAAKYQNDIKFQFRHLPLPQIHQNAIAASRAAEAAGLQNKFWEMHDFLYKNQPSWAESSNANQVFESFAQQIGLDMAQYKKDFSSKKVNDAINADIAAFKKTGEELSTPSFFLNGKRIKAASLDEFSKLIDEEIKKQNK